MRVCVCNVHCAARIRPYKTFPCFSLFFNLLRFHFMLFIYFVIMDCFVAFSALTISIIRHIKYFSFRWYAEFNIFTLQDELNEGIINAFVTVSVYIYIQEVDNWASPIIEVLASACACTLLRIKFIIHWYCRAAIVQPLKVCFKCFVALPFSSFPIRWMNALAKLTK